MLVLTRKSQQRIQIGSNIVITVLEVHGNTVSLGIDAPLEVKIMRTELMAGVDQQMARPAASEKRTGGSSAFKVGRGPGGVAPGKAGQDEHAFSAPRSPASMAMSEVRSPLAMNTQKVDAPPARVSLRPPLRLGPGALRGLVSARRR